MRLRISFLFALFIWSDSTLADVYSFGCGLSAPFPGQPELFLKKEVPFGNEGKVGVLGYGYTDNGRHLFFSGLCTYGVGQDPKDPEAELRKYLRERAASTGAELVQENYTRINGRLTATGVIRLRRGELVGLTYLVVFYSNRTLFNWAVQGVEGVSEKLASEEFKSGYPMVTGK